jgi:hypothetical protein
MTMIPTRGLRDEIEEGEVFFHQATYQTTSEDPFNYTITVGADRVRFQAEINTVCETTLTLYDTPTTSPVASGTLINMDLGSSNTIDLTLSYLDTVSAAGSAKATEKITEGADPYASPFRLANGLILKANTVYLFRVDPTGVTYSSYFNTLYFKAV